MWPLFYVLIVMFLFKKDVSETKSEKIFEKNNLKYLNIFFF